MKKIIILLLFPIFCISQNPGFLLLKKVNGVEIYYKLSKTKETEKKDTWLVESEYFNNTSNDIYYKSVKPDQDKSDKLIDNLLKTKEDNLQISNFASVFIQNTKALDFTSDSQKNITGDKTRIVTDKGENIYRLKKGKTYTLSMDFKGNKTVEPIISIQVINSISFTDNIFDFL